MQKSLQKTWYHPKLTLLAILLLPLSWLFRLIVAIRYFLYKTKIKKTIYFSVPVIVIGNITVGGTGKTPFVIWLAALLKEKGFKPGIVSRGAGGAPQDAPYWVDEYAEPTTVGDEALLLAHHTHCPVVISIDRVAAVKELVTQTDCNIIISDDGLQHYRLGRKIEIVIIDSTRGLGNKQFLPAGPLRESPARLKKVDFIIDNMQLQGDMLVSVCDAQTKIKIEDFPEKKIHAIAGTGNPERFFNDLRRYGFDIIEHAFPDHYLYKFNHIDFQDELPVIMTEKDAVKCKNFANKKHWYLPVEANISDEIKQKIMEQVCKLLKI